MHTPDIVTMTRAVIFDMDGLMLHTEPFYREAWKQASAECGYSLSDSICARLAGLRKTDAELLLLREFGARFSIEAFRTACEKAEATVFAWNRPVKKLGLDEILALLDSRDIPKAVATSTERNTAVFQLKAAGLFDRFNVVATGDEVSNGKPAPDLFLLAAQRLGVEAAACLVLEDSEAGVIAAHRAGMRVYLVPDLNPPTPEAKRVATAIFDSLRIVAQRFLELETL
jgi:HAD superfamily hydrolase (TIGR01509 family)